LRNADLSARSGCSAVSKENVMNAMNFGKVRSFVGSFVCACVLVQQAGAAIYRVNDDAPPGGNGQTWATAYRDLQSALAVARSGDQIWIASGTYRPAGPNGNRATSFVIPAGVAIYGGFRGNEISYAQRAGLFEDTRLSGDLNGNDTVPRNNNTENSYNVVRIDNSGCVLDGVNVERGNASGPGSGQNVSGAVRIVSGAAPAILNCFFSFNAATGSSGGGAMRLNGPQQISSSTFVGNYTSGTAGGGAVSADLVSFFDCSFVANVSDGSSGGGAIRGNGVLAVRCDFYRNETTVNSSSGGGALGGNAASLYSCRFVGNTATGASFGGGAVYMLSELFAVNCLFSANATTGSGSGGAIRMGGPANIVNCTIVNNASPANNNAGGVQGSGGIVQLSNCILWGNSNQSGISRNSQLSGGSFQTNYSCIQFLDGTVGGVGNIGAYPLFRSLLGPDYFPGTLDDDARLLSGSPCNDAGNANLLPPDAQDLDNDGNTTEPTPLDLASLVRRANDPAAPDTGAGGFPGVDMGAYELAPPRCEGDFNNDGEVDFFDYLDFVAAFDNGCPA
jgi:hypothetical protein